MRASPILFVRCVCVFAIASLTSTSLSQDHAPTAESCRADQALWGATHTETEYNEAETRHVQDGTPNRTEIAELNISQLKQRMAEMYQCSDVVEMEPYHSTGNFYYGVISDRYAAFLRRHGLMNQLIREDAEGKR